METSVVKRDARGEYSVQTVQRADGHSYEVVKRDCGDYVEFTPRGTWINHGGIKLTQGVIPIEPKVIHNATNNISLPFPEIVFKFPKNLPEDMTERMKVLTQIQDEAIRKVCTYIVHGYVISKAMVLKSVEEC